MRIVQIVGDVHNLSAGPTYSIARLAEELYRLGEDSSVLTLGRSPAEWPYQTPLGVHEGPIERTTGLSLAFVREVQALSRNPCILHGHSLWRLANNLYPLLLNRHAPARVVCSPRGTLSAWSMRYKALVKKPFWHLLQKPALHRCHCFHATSLEEYECIREVGLRGPVAVIPNGIDVPDSCNDRLRRKRIVFLSRIDPVKGIDMLLHAWASIQAEFTDWELVIAGPLKGAYPDSMQALAGELGAERVTFTGEVLGEAKRSLLQTASLFVLPSHSENFGIAVAEALAHGLPVITTTGTPWSGVSTHDCGWYVAPELNALRDALRSALTRPLAILHQMGINGHVWMQRDYSWAHIAGMMRNTYQWLLQGGQRPEWVITS